MLATCHYFLQDRAKINTRRRPPSRHLRKTDTLTDQSNPSIDVTTPTSQSNALEFPMPVSDSIADQVEKQTDNISRQPTVTDIMPNHLESSVGHRIRQRQPDLFSSSHLSITSEGPPSSHQSKPAAANDKLLTAGPSKTPPSLDDDIFSSRNLSIKKPTPPLLDDDIFNSNKLSIRKQTPPPLDDDIFNSSNLLIKKQTPPPLDDDIFSSSKLSITSQTPPSLDDIDIFGSSKVSVRKQTERKDYKTTIEQTIEDDDLFAGSSITKKKGKIYFHF